MRPVFLSLALLCVSSSVWAFDPKGYVEVELARLKATPEEFKNKKIFYISRYQGYKTTFPPYIEKSGFKPAKHYLLSISPLMVPVMSKKNDETNALIPTLPRGKAVKVYGKVEKFRIEPELTTLPRFYLDLDHIEAVEGDVPIQEMKEDKVNFDQPGPADNPAQVPGQIPFQKKKFNR